MIQSARVGGRFLTTTLDHACHFNRPINSPQCKTWGRCFEMLVYSDIHVKTLCADISGLAVWNSKCCGTPDLLLEPQKAVGQLLGNSPSAARILEESDCMARGSLPSV